MMNLETLTSSSRVKMGKKSFVLPYLVIQGSVDTISLLVISHPSLHDGL